MLQYWNVRNLDMWMSAIHSARLLIGLDRAVCFTLIRVPGSVQPLYRGQDPMKTIHNKQELSLVHHHTYSVILQGFLLIITLVSFYPSGSDIGVEHPHSTSLSSSCKGGLVHYMWCTYPPRYPTVLIILWEHH